MRRFLPLLALPLLLAACDQNATPPAAEVPAVDATVAAPAQPQPAPAETAELDLAPLSGNWAASPANCATPIVISPTAFEGAENVCEITQWTDNGDGSLTAAMTCQAAGETNSESIRMTPIFGPTGEGIRFEYLDRGGDPVTVFRCRG